MPAANISTSGRSAAQRLFILGCIGAVFFLAVGASGLMYVVNKVTRRAVRNYLTLHVISLPDQPASVDNIAKLLTKVRPLTVPLKTAGGKRTVEFTADEINLILSADMIWQSRAFVFKIRDHQIEAIVQVPLSGDLSGLHLTGMATLEVYFHNGLLKISPAALLIDGRPVYKKYMGYFQKINLVGGIYRNPEHKQLRDLLWSLHNIRVADGKVIVTY